MSIIEDVEKLRKSYLDQASDAFREQLERGRRVGEEMGVKIPEHEGVDRSGMFLPDIEPPYVEPPRDPFLRHRHPGRFRGSTDAAFARRWG